MEFLAKSNGITLMEHSIQVVKQVEEILSHEGITDETIINLVKIAAAIHDCGKTSHYFQNYLTIGGNDNFPRHNEIGFGLIEFIVDKEYGMYKNDKHKTDLIRYVTLYHHKPFNEEKWLNDLFSDNNEINKISKYYNNIFKKCGIDNIVRCKENISEDEFEECDIQVGTENTFSFIKLNNIKDSQDNLAVFQNVFNIVRFADYIVSEGYEFNPYRKNPNITNLNLVMPSHFDKKRWDEQCSVADKAFGKILSLIPATMGWGKTLCGINYLLHSNKKGFWVCPDNALCIATYENICTTLKECNISNLNVCLLLSGTWEKCNWENNGINISDADIIVTNIDTYVNGIFRNSRKEISFESLFSNCIFDEYHEYALTSTPLLPLFLASINARRGMNNVKTLLLSGTAINKGYVGLEEDDVINAGENLEKEKKTEIIFLTASDYYKNYINTPNSVHIYTRIKSCQDSFDNGDMDYCFHSLFDDNDTTGIIDDIMVHNGKNAKLKASSVSSTSVFSRGIDVSFTNAFLINPTPEMIEQIIGRTGNRWDFSVIGKLYIVLDYRKTELFIYKETNSWEKYYSKYIEHLRSKINNAPISTFDLKNIRINFFEKNSDKQISYKRIVQNNLRKGLELLSKIVFTDGSYIGTQELDSKHIKDGADVRGDALTRFFAIQIEGEPFGVLSGPINIPSYRFGGEDFINLYNGDIIANIKRYFRDNSDIAKKYNIKNLKKWKDRNLINNLIKQAKSSETPFPLLCNYKYTRKKGFLW